MVFASSGGAAAIGLLALVSLYFTPTIVAVVRGVEHQGSVIVINVFLGWTLVGWVVSLAMACRTKG